MNNNEKKKEESLNNFKSEDMSTLEKVDPGFKEKWNNKKKRRRKRLKEEQTKMKEL